MSEFNLIREITSRSENKVWDFAKREWDLNQIFQSDDEQRCLCGHFPIKEICVLMNRLNGGSADVGNCCVKKFMSLPSNLIFDGFKRIQKDIKAALNEAAIDYVINKGWVDEYSQKFLISTMRKRDLSYKQEFKRVCINKSIIDLLKADSKAHAKTREKALCLKIKIQPSTEIKQLPAQKINFRTRN